MCILTWNNYQLLLFACVHDTAVSEGSLHHVFAFKCDNYTLYYKCHRHRLARWTGHGAFPTRVGVALSVARLNYGTTKTTAQ